MLWGYTTVSTAISIRSLSNQIFEIYLPIVVEKEENYEMIVSDFKYVVYNSNIYHALLRPTSNLYSQSSGYVYQYLDKELKAKR